MKTDKLKSKIQKAQYCNRADMKSECRWGTLISNFGSGDGWSASGSNTSSSSTTNASNQKRLQENLTRRAMNEKLLGLERDHRMQEAQVQSLVEQHCALEGEILELKNRRRLLKAHKASNGPLTELATTQNWPRHRVADVGRRQVWVLANEKLLGVVE
eukprot:CAMPEP_0198213514 /NCGR_PEP_ID=MMETSP1445-20131203/28915_1 /TAXON_ID=36898 /ORGANISM="Pyramimonas sp., Strain CCMP2087" /LENGTH=157 /DNA_ID=CAMNT_0043888173 /DNA_START=255 /DNA_END=728 /DNA_ORIENTATION=-